MTYRILLLIITCPFIFVFVGCTPKTLNVQQTLNSGKSIIIMPKHKAYDKQIFWGKVNGSKYYMKSLTEDGISISQDYMATPINTGIYYIKWAQIENQQKQEKKITNKEKYISDIGEANLQRSPIAMKIKTRTKYTYRERSNNAFYIDPVYKTTYYFSSNKNSSNAIGFLTVNSHEIILMPNIWFEIDLAENSCRFADEWLNIFWFKVIYDIGNNFNDEFDTLEWLCPIKSIIINVKKGSIDDFAAQIDQKDFPEKLLERIVVRGFEFGGMFKNAKKMENSEDGIERYIIDGSADK
jgi:hypothetical protein